MSLQRKRKFVFIGIVLVELIMLVCFVLNTQKKSNAINDVEFTSEMFNSAQDTENGVEVFESVAAMDPAYIGVNRRIFSPELLLMKGIYQVDVYYQSNTTSGSSQGGHAVAISKDDAGWLDSESVLLSGYTNHMNYRVYVGKDNTNASLRVLFDDNCPDAVSIDKMVISYWDGRTILVGIIKLLLLFGVIDFALFLFLYKKEKIEKISISNLMIVLAFVVILFLIQLPMTTNYVPKGYDLRFHYYRIYTMAMGLQDGMFPVRIQPEWLLGYGYATGVFYGDILLYLPAAMYALGFTLSSAYKVYVLMINAITIFGSFFCFKTISKNKYIGLTGCIIYTFSLHRLVATYTRAALGAFSAMAFLPFVILGLWAIYYCEDEKKSNKWLYLVVGLTGILETHILGTLMTVFFLVIFLVVSIKKTFSPKVLMQLLKVGITTILLNLFFVLPFLDLYINSPLRIQGEYRPIQEYSAFLAQLFTSRYNAIGDVREDLVGMLQDMPMTVGPASLIVIIFAVITMILYKNKKDRNKTILLLEFIALALWLSTNSFPYTWLEEYAPAVFYVFMKFEFAWRFQAIATILLATLSVQLLCVLKDKLSKEKIFAIGGVVTLLFVWQGTDYIFQYNNSMMPFEYENTIRDISISAVYNGQYLFEGMDEMHLDYSIVAQDAENMEMTVNRVRRLEYSVSVKNSLDTENSIEFPLIPYMGYHASSNNGELIITQGENQRMKVVIPPKFEGNIHIYYAEPWYWRVAEVVSLLTLILIIAYAIVKKSKVMERDIID